MSCSRIGGRPPLRASRRNQSVMRSGWMGEPSGRVNTKPESIPAGPTSARSCSCRTLCSCRAASVAGSSASDRLPVRVWARTRTLPWRVAATLGIGAGGGVVGSLLAPRLGLVIGGLAAMVAGWRLRFRPSLEAIAWRRGAVGERRTARLLDPLERHGWAVLHDVALTGSRVNIDHLAIGPGGVFVIDSKQYRGRLQLDPSGKLWHGRYPLAPALRAVSFEADQAAKALPDPGVAVVPIVAVHGAQVPWGKVVTDGVPVVSARRLPSMLRALPAVLGPERVADLADRARVRFRAAAEPHP